MDKRTDMLTSASRAFDAQGFRGVGIDGVLAACGASTRTLYKHFGSRDGLVLAVLDQRHRDFMDLLARQAGDDPVGQLFDTLTQWFDAHPARGCMLLRARAEYAGANERIVTLVCAQKAEFEAEVARRVETALGRPDAMLATQVWLLFEGATAAASVAGAPVVEAGRQAAQTLVALARGAA